MNAAPLGVWTSRTSGWRRRGGIAQRPSGHATQTSACSLHPGCHLWAAAPQACAGECGTRTPNSVSAHVGGWNSRSGQVGASARRQRAAARFTVSPPRWFGTGGRVIRDPDPEGQSQPGTHRQKFASLLRGQGTGDRGLLEVDWEVCTWLNLPSVKCLMEPEIMLVSVDFSPHRWERWSPLPHLEGLERFSSTGVEGKTPLRGASAAVSMAYLAASPGQGSAGNRTTDLCRLDQGSPGETWSMYLFISFIVCVKVSFSFPPCLILARSRSRSLASWTWACWEQMRNVCNWCWWSLRLGKVVKAELLNLESILRLKVASCLISHWH